MQLAFSDGSHIVDNPAQYAAAHLRLGGGVVGIGATQDAGSIAAIASQGAATAGGIVAGLSAMGALSPMFALAGPIGAAVAGLVSIGLAIANVFSGCGNTCVEATSIANQVGALLVQMLDTYMAAPIHYASMQKAYLVQWDAAFAALTKACSDPSLGQAGVNCIADRQQGACHYHTSPGGWQQQNGQWIYVSPGADGSGNTCWNWYTGSRDPVANDPTVVPDPVGAIVDPTTGDVTGITPTGDGSLFTLPGGASIGPLLLIAGGVGAAMLLLGSD